MENASLTLRMASPEFTVWAAEKKLGPRDLAPLRAVHDETFLRNILAYFGAAKPNKNLGTQALEWAVDLHLMGKPISIPPVGSRDAFMRWYSDLKDARFADRAARRAALAGHLQRAAWPRNVSAQPIEKGDTLGFEVKIFAQSAEDFAQKLSQLARCSQQLSQKAGDAE